ncbi:MAG TPA: glycoside hydrolase family 2 TIM barrel-domain containing protein, partial [Propionibacteriaceae bacterium]|nr:glycoside hydrolase family 2 TIM barrel-domain containing protein [Propionibacteriaceae bacterium]
MSAKTQAEGRRTTSKAVRLDRWTVRAPGGDPRDVMVPGPAVPLGWGDWHESSWETIWTWTTTVELGAVPAYADLEIGAVLGRIAVRVNEVEVGTGESGFLPCTFDVASALRPGPNTVEIVEDARWRRVPPMGSPLGASDVDFFLPAGIHRPVVLRLSDVATVLGMAVRSSGLLTGDPVVTVTLTSPVGTPAEGVVSARIVRESDGALVAEARHGMTEGRHEISLTLRPGGQLELWSPEEPVLHRVEAHIECDGEVLAAGELRTGFREVSWTREGLRLNGERRRVVGLNRHELFPFVGFAASDRVQRNDARILKEELGVDLVRCSHYPPSDAFLDACDELGLLVFEEAPGWQYAGTVQRDPVYADPWQPVPLEDRDPEFERLHVDQVRRMIERDRHRPSVVVWGTFLNETRAFTPDLWDVVVDAARELDPDRAVAGATRFRQNGHESGSFDSAHDARGRKVWPFDVFGFNDYRLDAHDGPDFLPPVADYPYLVTEAIGQMPRFREWFIRGDRSGRLSQQALYHAEAVELAFTNDVVGVIGWVAFDYPSPHGSLWGSDDPGLGPRGHALKTSGVADIFRIPKPAAAVYRAQCSPTQQVVLEPAFTWDALTTGPLCFASNCEELLVRVDAGEWTHLVPDRASYPRTPHPLFVLGESDAGAVELHVRGRIGGRDAAELRLTRDTSRDHLEVRADDPWILGDGVDSTRVAFQVSDAFGNLRATAAGPVRIRVEGPGVLIGSGVLDLPASAGAVWIRSSPGSSGAVLLHL